MDVIFNHTVVTYNEHLKNILNHILKSYQILNEIEGDYYTYTGDKAEGIMLRLYRLKPKVGQRKELSATSVKNEMYESVLGGKTEWEKQVPEPVAEIINKNWNIVEKFASSEDNTTRVLGMKFPREGYT